MAFYDALVLVKQYKYYYLEFIKILNPFDSKIFYSRGIENLLLKTTYFLALRHFLIWFECS